MSSSKNLGSFCVALSSSDRKLIDSSVDEIIRAVSSSGAKCSGPILRKNYFKDNVLYHTRKIKVTPTVDTAAALDGLNLSKEVSVRLLRE